ncbi:MAG: hotdog fold domain-containing protein [Pseudomonadota bacterium]
MKSLILIALIFCLNKANASLDVTFLGMWDEAGRFLKAESAVIFPGKEVEFQVRVKNHGNTSAKVLIQIWSPSGELLARFKHFKISNYSHESIQSTVGTLRPGETVKMKFWLEAGKRFFGNMSLPLVIKAIKENGRFEVETVLIPVSWRHK